MMTGIAEKILSGGETLVRVDGAFVLASNAAPGDLLELRLLGKRRGTARAKIVQVIEASDKRVAPPCPLAGICGGCALQFISSAEQAEVKSGWVSEAFKSLMHAETEWIPVHPHEGRFRRRVRWFVGNDERGSFPGFYAPASHRPVRHSGCMAVTPQINAVRQFIEDEVDLRCVNSIQAVQLDDGMHIVLEADSRPETIETDQLEGLPVQWWWRDSRRIARPLRKPAYPFHELLPAADAQVRLAVGPDDFVQGQKEGNRELISQIQDWAGPVARVADLFCGIGNLSLPLAAATGAHVFGAELNVASVRAANSNAKMLGVAACYVAANLFEAFDMEAYIGADVLILDPPRRGAKRLCNQMPRLLPGKIVMLSCDPASGARDGALLQRHGYRLKALRALDLFPFAGHVEAMSLWTAE
jgi:23S rRNA (uracil1939-C5)-methyltransferase